MHLDFHLRGFVADYAARLGWTGFLWRCCGTNRGIGAECVRAGHCGQLGRIGLDHGPSAQTTWPASLLQHFARAAKQGLGGGRAERLEERHAMHDPHPPQGVGVVP